MENTFDSETETITAPDGNREEQKDTPQIDSATREAPDSDAVIEQLTEMWKRALADAENARKRANVARVDGREHGIALAVEALAPALDALSLGIEASRTNPDADDPRILAHLEGLRNIRASFETGLKALGIRTIAPENTPFDPKLHEAMGTEEAAETEAGQVLVLHRPGFAIGHRLIRPARVTVSAAPVKEKEA